jgi:hypothetical protein
MSDFISIDWDFFLYNGEWEPEIPGFDLDGKPDTFLGSLVYDWGHNEAHSSGLGEMLWHTRWAQFRMMGMDPLAMTGYRGLEPAEMLTHIPQAPWGFIADSHSYGYFPARWMSATNVVSFDAHHDLGYNNKQEHARQREGTIACDNWLSMLLYNGAIERATIVYPDWKGTVEIEDVDWKKRLGAKRHKVRFTTWSEWVAEHEPLTPISLYACRSSAWTPPWWDGEFAKLVEALPVLKRENLDETYDEHSLRKVGAYNAGEPRAWDMAGAEEHAAQSIAMIKQHSDMLRA